MFVEDTAQIEMRLFKNRNNIWKCNKILYTYMRTRIKLEKNLTESQF